MGFARGASRFARAIRVTSAFALGSGLMLDPSDAQAYCRTTTAAAPPSYDPVKNGCIESGLVLFWRGACVTYAVERSGAPGLSFEETSSIVDRGFATWQNARCAAGDRVGIELVNLGAVECTEVRYNPGSPNQNLIVFREESWPYNDAANTLGLTTITFNAETGEMYDADMEINATAGSLSFSDIAPANGFDLLSVVTHEAGHFLGLAHATNNTSTMFVSYKPGTTTLRSLAPEDVEGVCAIYPNAKTRVVDSSVASGGTLLADACNPVPRHGFTTECGEAAAEEKGSCRVAPKSGSSSRGAPLSLGFLGGIAATFAVLRRARRQRRSG